MPGALVALLGPRVCPGEEDVGELTEDLEWHMLCPRRDVPAHGRAWVGIMDC